MAWFVVLEHTRKDGSGIPFKSNIILMTTHPLTWASNPPSTYNETYRTKLLFWEQIDDSLVTHAVSQWCTIED
jgi:hypothetical protein